VSDQENARQALQSDLHTLIPLSGYMEIRISALGPAHIELEAPLGPNHNHAGTGFAGAIYSVAVLAGWALLRHATRQAGVDAELVIADAQMHYQRPVTGDIVAHTAITPEQLAELTHRLGSGRRVRLPLVIQVGDPEDPDATLQGRYFARP